MRHLLTVIALLPVLLQAAPPTFESYSVDVHPIKKSARTKIPKSGTDGKVDRFLRYSDDEPVTFAAKYTFGEIGCGAGCFEFCLIDRTTGKVYPGADFSSEYPRDYEGPTGFQYCRNSRLLIVYHALGAQYPVRVSYYVWDGTKLKLLETHDIPKKT